MRPIGWILLIAVTVGGIGGLRFLDLHPIYLKGSPAERTATGRPPKLAERGDVAILVNRAAIAQAAQARTFSGADFSCAWMNLIEAELGVYSLVEAAEANLASYRAAVLTASAHRSIAPATLRQFVEDGGVVFIDGPDENAPWPDIYAELSGVRAEGMRPFPTRELLPSGGITNGDRAAFDAVPFGRPERVVSLIPEDDVIRRSTLFFERSLGAGRVLSTPLNVARLYTTMLQGKPTSDDFTLEPRFGDYDDILEPDDLISDAALRENEVPFADLFARAVVSLLDPTDAPLPRLLWFPHDSSGIFLMTHDEDFRAGEKSLELAKWDESLGVRGTTFVISTSRLFDDWLTGDDDRPYHQRRPDEPADYAAQMAACGAAVGFHWNQFAMRYGVGPVEPVEFHFSSHNQIERLRELSLATANTRINRNHYLIQRARWTEHFRVLAGNNIRLDTTFGSNKGRGYLFGTARPYSILDENGFPIAILELPFINQEDWGGADAAYFDRMLEANSRRHKGSIVSLFHSHLRLQDEDGKELYTHIVKKAEETGHRSMNFNDLLEFTTARSNATVRSRVAGDDWIIETSSPERQPDRSARRSSDGTTDIESFELSLAFPVGAGKRSVTLEAGKPVPLERLEIGGQIYERLQLPPGESRITVKNER